MRWTTERPTTTAAAVAVLLLGCAGPQPKQQHPLSATFLLDDTPLQQPVDMQAFTPPDSAAGPQHEFAGTLRLTTVATGFRAIHDPWNRAGEIGPALRYLPEFEFDFVQRGPDLVPLATGVQRRAHPYWEIIVLPGQAWQSADDRGWSRAAVPFALQERAANCTHNGVMTWLFRDDEISRVAYQVVSETCGYFKADLWGVVDAEYVPATRPVDADAAIARLDAHRSARLPVRPLAQLAVDYPGIDAANLGVGDGIPADDISVLGLVVDGIHYRSDCPTRQGQYPFCAALSLPSYSTAKSIFAGLALMRLEAMYPGVSRQAIATLVPECDLPKWRDVTIEDALDMATGNFDSARIMADEDAAPHEAFVFDDQHESKLAFACRHFPRKAEPGSQFVYHTSDTYLVGVALQRFLEQQEGGDVYDAVLLEPVWKMLGLSSQLDLTKRTYDAAAQPFTGYGLTFEADDVARIARWLTSPDAREALAPAMLDAALQRSPDDPGLTAGDESLRYNNGFWAYDAGPSLECDAPVWTPFMSGVSGITVALFPNEVIYYYVSDSYVFRWQTGRIAASHIRSLCREQR